MKLARYGLPGSERPALVDADGNLRDLSAHISDITGTTLGNNSLAALAALDPAALPIVEGEPRLGPCVGAVGKFLCIGLNYSDHAAETGAVVPPGAEYRGGADPGPHPGDRSGHAAAGAAKPDARGQEHRAAARPAAGRLVQGRAAAGPAGSGGDHRSRRHGTRAGGVLPAEHLGAVANHLRAGARRRSSRVTERKINAAEGGDDARSKTDA